MAIVPMTRDKTQAHNCGELRPCNSPQETALCPQAFQPFLHRKNPEIRALITLLVDNIVHRMRMRNI